MPSLVNGNVQEIYSMPATRDARWLTAQRMLLGVWLIMGVLPLALQIRSYTQFVRPAKMSEILVVPQDQQQETANLTEVCPVEAFVLAGVWWNFEPTHYYHTDNGTICHAVVPQYNTHGNYFIGSSKVTPYRTSPSRCENDSFPFEVYFYHASIGFYSFYEGETGTYCAKERISYIQVNVLGSYDINGSFLAKDTGSRKARVSYWYGIVGAFWLGYRALMIRKGYVLCTRYGRRCDELGETLCQEQAVVFVQESLRLSAHGASNYQRAALLYLIVEGIMTDLFLIIANDGWATRVQYGSLGYNLSGLMLLLFEMVESMNWLSEKWRMRIKRVFFSYEVALVGELVTALGLQAFLSGLNKSDLKRSKPTALAVSYYVWGLVCHGVVVVTIIGIISSVRVLWAMVFVWLKHRSFAILSKPCCVDTALGVRSRIMLLSGYCLESGELYYRPSALKAFGMLKMEEEGAEYLIMHKLHWFTVPSDNLIGIGTIAGSRVKPCNERPCTGIVSFLKRRLGGASNQTKCYQDTVNQRTIKVRPQEMNDIA
ncbi:hypothetical protein PC129_g5279 [Phytophthora cactorum]|uniref:Uncharacterized protein n=1 Tax=Phytophthora cactorum TaxID=29920 RepID=A0A8T1IM59_9STRA|nr:hypothetical protein Pcac1_g27918 [Phytophthora cactorum]KAG2916792.1 hypothetical protein PC114_g7390 [Phytophthora cactorum]KAG3092463.1 hypothetical protein PC122_g6538 [Phytophthora cactorum]KAG3224062.1 hypothetical protein PC129_g5279 [Phytophthora cactorum]